ncbi:MAG: threonyl-tRNA synthetase editing domain-containing protein [Patescibacteria group bacterium]|nr:threonyl-tRNA synthetase editing domain-containing protein [Patescibacteria group bacterium]
MRLIVFNGKFGHLQENINQGLVALCHFEPEDDEKIIFKVAEKLIKLTNDNLILVPFAHLFEKVAEKPLAKNFFESLIAKCKELDNNKNIISIPFGVEKEFFLYAPADDEAIKFMNF